MNKRIVMLCMLIAAGCMLMVKRTSIAAGKTEEFGTAPTPEVGKIGEAVEAGPAELLFYNESKHTAQNIEIASIESKEKIVEGLYIDAKQTGSRIVPELKRDTYIVTFNNTIEPSFVEGLIGAPVTTIKATIKGEPIPKKRETFTAKIPLLPNNQNKITINEDGKVAVEHRPLSSEEQKEIAQQELKRGGTGPTLKNEARWKIINTTMTRLTLNIQDPLNLESTKKYPSINKLELGKPGITDILLPYNPSRMPKTLTLTILKIPSAVEMPNYQFEVPFDRNQEITIEWHKEEGAEEILQLKATKPTPHIIKGILFEDKEIID